MSLRFMAALQVFWSEFRRSEGMRAPLHRTCAWAGDGSKGMPLAQP